MRLMRQKVLPDLAKSRQSGKKVLPDVAKSRQSGSKKFQRVPSGPRGSKGGFKGKCYQMWPKVAKGVPRRFQGVPMGSKGGTKEDSKGVSKRGSKGGFQGKVLPGVTKSLQRGSKGKCYQMWQKVAKGVLMGSQGL